jgi:hypothetical protein
MKGLLDSIKNPVWRAFAWRVYNNFIAFILPVVAGAIITYFDNNDLPIAISSFANVDLWNCVLGSVVITLLGSVTSGIWKAARVEEEIKMDINDEG